ncbi:MAG: VWA domain-containing protein [Candidatus Caenarcaniphilales bacterium]|nr:VWA domain-containing protein [Candidatus Caenarcaniphilales bacterium]
MKIFNFNQKLFIPFWLLIWLSFGFTLNANCANPFLKNKEVVLSGSLEDDNSKAVMIVLDASGSMSEPAPSAATKMLMAKNVLEQVLSKIDSTIPVGLRVYGSSKLSADPVIACQDSTLLVPPGVGNRRQMVNKLRGIKPTGATPISYSMRKAVDDLSIVDAKKKSVVLISDGIETCAYDPCALAQSFKERGVDIQFNVVGFNVNNDYAAKAQLECIAKSTDGKFYTAETSGQLAESVLDGVNYSAPSIDTVSGQLKELKSKGK